MNGVGGTMRVEFLGHKIFTNISLHTKPGWEGKKMTGEIIDNFCFTRISKMKIKINKKT
jgi:hypothetical protein